MPSPPAPLCPVSDLNRRRPVLMILCPSPPARATRRSCLIETVAETESEHLSSRRPLAERRQISVIGKQCHRDPLPVSSRLSRGDGRPGKRGGKGKVRKRPGAAQSCVILGDYGRLGRSPHFVSRREFVVVRERSVARHVKKFGQIVSPPSDTNKGRC